MFAQSQSHKHLSHACRRLGILPTRYALGITISEQCCFLFETPAGERARLLKTYRCSTSRFGIGQQAGSNCTPLGLHRVAEKIGGGWPVGSVFKGRRFVGYTWQGLPLAPITTRILWLEGLEPGFNRGAQVDSHSRYIYIHGTGDEPTLGRPASHGCIHLAADDLIRLFNLVPEGTLVWIER
jgi:hypothetical protein